VPVKLKRPPNCGFAKLRVGHANSSVNTYC
jgi:hypothetical protein